MKQFADHQMSMEKQALTSDTGQGTLGLVAAFVLCMTLIVGGIFCICLGHDWAGATIIGGCVVALGGAFLHNQSKKKQEPKV